jgi:single-stranded DNA-binding protein
MTNKVELSGRVYNSEVRKTSSGKTVIRFGLSVYAGKDKEGKSVYHFVNCKYWGVDIENNMDIEVVGKICFDTWEKDGRQNVRPYILIDSFQPHQRQAQAQAQENDEQGELGGW